MTFTRDPYDTAAAAVLFLLDRIANRASPEHDNALEALSILSTFRDAAAFGRELVEAGTVRYLASTGVSLATVDTLDEARAYAAQGDHRHPTGRAIVEVDYTGAEPLFTRHALEAPRLESSAGGIVFAALAEIAADEAAAAEPKRFETEAQLERARKLASMAPLGRTPIDDELDALGWTRRYDGEPYSTELTPAAQAAMVDDLGRLDDRFRPA